MAMYSRRESTQVSLVHHDHVVEILAAERTDDPLGGGIGLGGAEGRQDRLDPNAAWAGTVFDPGSPPARKPG